MAKTYKAHELSSDEVQEILADNDARGIRSDPDYAHIKTKDDFVSELKHRGVNPNVPIERKLIDKMAKKYGFTNDRFRKGYY